MQFLFLGFLLCLVNAQTTLRCWNLRGSTLEQKDCPASPTNGPPYCTHYDFQGDLIVACSNQDVCVKLANLGYSNFVCCNTTLCNYPDNFTPPANNTPTPEPDPANLGPDGVLQCYDYNDDVSKENRTVVNCPDLQNSKARCVRYTRVYDVPDPEEARSMLPLLLLCYLRSQPLLASVPMKYNALTSPSNLG